MRDEISTWQELVASGLAATQETLVLFTPYALVAQGEGGSLSLSRDHIMFYGGPSVLTQPLPPTRNAERIKLAVGELIVPTIRLAPKAPTLPRSAITFGLVEPTGQNNPLGRTREYACIRTGDVHRLKIQRIPLQRESAEPHTTKEVQSA